MNVSEAHVVVVAKDSGIPPRETSVPVVVHFPNQRASELKQKVQISPKIFYPKVYAKSSVHI